jgi:L-threonylcarbamoyladenylate synthase
LSKNQKKLIPIEKIRKINPDNPEPEFINEAARVIRQGGVVSFPTRCFYGLGVDAFNIAAVDRIFKIKQRAADKPILVLIKDQKDLPDLVKYIPQKALKIMEHLWPGRITMVFDAIDTLPENLTAGSGKIGIRLPGHKVAAELVRAVGNPITGTSANLSGAQGAHRILDLNPHIADTLDLILDAGPLKGGVGSTVVDMTTNPPRILREGEVVESVIFSVFDNLGFEDN